MSKGLKLLKSVSTKDILRKNISTYKQCAAFQAIFWKARKKQLGFPSI